MKVEEVGLKSALAVDVIDEDKDRSGSFSRLPISKRRAVRRLIDRGVCVSRANKGVPPGRDGVGFRLLVFNVTSGFR